MRKILVIANREYHAMVRTKAFLITILLMPVLMLGGLLVQKLMEGRTDVSDKKVVVLDGTGALVSDLSEELKQRNELVIYDTQTKRQISPRIVVEPAPAGPVTDELRFALSERVRKNELFAFVEIAPDILDRPPSVTDTGAVLYGEGLAFNEARRRLESALESVVQAQRLRRAGLDPAVVNTAMRQVRVEGLGLYTRSDSGVIKKPDETSSDIASFIPLGMLMLMFMSLMMAAQPMLQSVLEEKQQRIAEVMLGSARPFDIMMGKLLGNVAVSLTILAIYFGGIYSMAARYEYTELLPLSLMGWFVAYEVLAVLLFGSLFLAVGASCTDLKEAQNYLLPVSLVMVFPLFVWFEVMRAPMSGFATGISFFPPATPMLMLLRMSATKAVPLWQPLAGVAVVLLTVLVVVFAAGRIFRIGLLSQGKAPKFSELLGWVIRG